MKISTDRIEKQNTSNTSRIRLGLLVVGSAGWHGGITYLLNIVKAFKTLPEGECPRLFLLCPPERQKDLALHEELFPLVEDVISFQSIQEVAGKVDLLFPANKKVYPNLPVLNWIPDFQHIHLPHFFSNEEIHQRNAFYESVRSQSRFVVFSSMDAEKDFNQNFSGYQGSSAILNFHTFLDYDSVLNKDPNSVMQKYSLPERFLLCPNQIWAHKNHGILVEAIAALKKRGLELKVVCTGNTRDYRDPDYFSRLQKKIREEGVADHFQFLGMIPLDDLRSIMRICVSIVQPSLFEGWSTVVEDARSLCVPIVLSDLAVHKEQDPPYAEFFAGNNVDELAEKMLMNWYRLDAGPNIAREQEAKEKAVQLQRSFGEALLKICTEAMSVFHPGWLNEQAKPLLESQEKTVVDTPKITPENPEKAKLLGLFHRNGDQLDTLVSLGLSYFNENKFFIAFGFFTAAKNLVPNNPDIEEAIQNVKKALSGKPFPKISITIPNYNQGSYLEKCFQSIFDQNYPNLDITVFDGASTDNSVEVIQKYAAHFSYWQSEKDNGQTHAIQMGLEKSSGEIFNWLCGDDYLKPMSLFYLAQCYDENPNAAAWVGATERLHENGWLHFVSHPSNLTTQNLKANFTGRFAYQPSLFMNRAKVLEAGGFDVSLHYAMEYDMYRRLADCGEFAIGEGVWSVALAQLDAKTVTSANDAWMEKVPLLRKEGLEAAAQMLERRVQTGVHGWVYPKGWEQRIPPTPENQQLPHQHANRNIHFIQLPSDQGKIQQSLDFFKNLFANFAERFPNQQYWITTEYASAIGPAFNQIPGVVVSENYPDWNQVLQSIIPFETEASEQLLSQLKQSKLPVVAKKMVLDNLNLKDRYQGFAARTSDELIWQAGLIRLEPLVWGAMICQRVAEDKLP